MPSLLFAASNGWNSPYINHFISADTVVSSYANPQGLNRFAYVLNNPLRYIDPTGHKETECSSQTDPLCSAANGGSTGNTNSGAGNGNGKNKSKHGDDPGGDVLGPGNQPKDKLTDVQLVGQVATLALIETTLLLPIDYALVELTTDGVEACMGGVLLACVADIPIGAADVVAADFQISLANTVAKNIQTHTQHEFEWLIIPKLLSVLPAPIQHDIYDALPGLEVKDE
jgi:hypothetical protein